MTVRRMILLCEGFRGWVSFERSQISRPVGMWISARAQLFTVNVCFNLWWNNVKIYHNSQFQVPPPPPPLKSIVLRSSVSHRLRHWDLDFCPRLGGTVFYDACKMTARRMVPLFEGSRYRPNCEPNQMSRPIEMWPLLRAQLFTACLCFNFVGYTIKIATWTTGFEKISNGIILKILNEL